MSVVAFADRGTAVVIITATKIVVVNTAAPITLALFMGGRFRIVDLLFFDSTSHAAKATVAKMYTLGQKSGRGALKLPLSSVCIVTTAGWNASAQQPARDFGPDLG